jgi:hypothetical protein
VDLVNCTEDSGRNENSDFSVQTNSDGKKHRQKPPRAAARTNALIGLCGDATALSPIDEVDLM